MVVGRTHSLTPLSGDYNSRAIMDRFWASYDQDVDSLHLGADTIRKALAG
jgi:hypothetical protein